MLISAVSDAGVGAGTRGTVVRVFRRRVSEWLAGMGWERKGGGGWGGGG